MSEAEKKTETVQEKTPVTQVAETPKETAPAVPQKRMNMPSVVKQKYFTIERIWAENCMVKIQTQDGTVRQFIPEDAAKSMRQTLKTHFEPHIRKHINEVATKVYEACRTAKAQRENPFKSKKESAASDLLSVREKTGPEITALQTAFRQYPFVPIEELKAIIGSKTATPYEKRAMLEMRNNDLAPSISK